MHILYLTTYYLFRTITIPIYYTGKQKVHRKDVIYVL